MNSKVFDLSSRRFCQKILFITSSSNQARTFSIKQKKDNQSLATKHSWNEEWKSLGFGVQPSKEDAIITNLLFVQTGFGVDQHGDRVKDGATKAAIRAVRNAIEFNSIPGMIEAVPGGRKEMLIQVKLGIPAEDETSARLVPMNVDLDAVAKVFPYGKLMPIIRTVGGLKFPTGRIVYELGDNDDEAIVVAASVGIGYDSGERKDKDRFDQPSHRVYNTKDGY